MDRDKTDTRSPLLTSIGWLGEDAMHMTFNTASGMMHAANEYGIAVGRMTVKLFSHYSNWCKKRGCQLESAIIAAQEMVLRELLMNAAEHGNRWEEDKKIQVSVWICEEGIAIGCRDEGDFFKQKEVKKKIEKRQRVHAVEKEGRGCGTRFMYEYMNEIFVDIETGTIFLALRYDRSGVT